MEKKKITKTPAARRSAGTKDEKVKKSGNADAVKATGKAGKADKGKAAAGKAGKAVEESRKRAFPKPGNFLYPVPPAMVSLGGGDDPKNIITIAWTGTICSDPPMVSISVRKERFSYEILKRRREFVINLPNRALAYACDFCGCTTGAKTDKFKEAHLTPGESTVISAPTIEEAPISIECVVKQIIPLGSHDMFLAEVKAVQADSRYMDENGKFHMEKADLVAYSHGKYYGLGKIIGTFGYSVRKKK